MMQKLRKKTRLVLFIVLAGFASLIFFNWGLDITGIKRSEETNIAEIEDVPVSYTDYIRFARSKENEFRGISRDEIWNLLLEEITWSKLIKQERIRVTDSELWAIIRANPPREIYESEYMKDENGNFDFNRYYELLKSPQSSAWLLEYEYNLRREVPRQKIRSLLASFGWVSPHEDSIGLVMQTTKYDISYVNMLLFRARQLLELSDGELREYFDAHQEEFITPELKILKFVFFERKPSPYDTLEAKESIEDFIVRIDDGEDFFEVAREVSDDTVIAKKFEGPAELKPYLMNVYKKLKDGEVSGVIKAAHGFEVIKRKRKGLIYRVKIDIKVSPTTVGEIADNIMSFKEVVRDVGFDSAAAELGLPVRKTYPMNQKNVSFPVRTPENLAAFMSTAKIGDLGGPFASVGGFYIFTLDSIIPQKYPKFEEIKTVVGKKMERLMLKQILADRLNEYYNRLMAGETMSKILSEDTLLEFNNVEDVTISQIHNALGGDVAGAVANLENGQTSLPIITDWAGYIVHCDKKVAVPFDSTMLAALQMKRQQRLQDITTKIFMPKEIEDNRDNFFE
jgi:hypothetical protein